MRPLGSASLVALLAVNGCSLFQDTDDDGGRLLWRVTEKGNYGLPWHDSSFVYFLGNKHQVIAVDKKSGEVKWETLLPANGAGTVGFGGGVSQCGVIVGDEDLFCLDRTSGALVWRFQPAEGSGAGRKMPTVTNSMVLAGSQTAHVYSIDPLSGKTIWSTRIRPADVTIYRPVVANGRVLVSFTDFTSGTGHPLGGVAALDFQTGAIIWSRLLPQESDTIGPTATLDPVAVGSIVAVASRSGPVYAFDQATGEQRWKATRVTLNPDVRPLGANQSLVFVGSTTGLLQALNPETGSKVWEVSTGTESHQFWLVADESHVYVATFGSRLQVYRTQDGGVAWKAPELVKVALGPSIDDDRLFVGSATGLFALRR